MFGSRLLLTALLGIAIAWPSLAATQKAAHVPKKLTLDDAISLALHNNVTIQNAHLSRRTQKYTLLLAKYDFKPHYSLTASADYARGRVSGDRSETGGAFTLAPSVSLKNRYGTTVNLSGGSNNYESQYTTAAEFTVTQPLMRGLGEDVNLESLRNAHDTDATNKLALRQTVISTIDSVVTQYRAVISAQISMSISKNAVKLADRNIKDVRTFIKAGTRPRADLTSALAQKASSASTLASAEFTLLQARKTLADTMGVLNTDFIVPKTLRTPNYKVPSLVNAKALARKSDPSYLQAKLAVIRDKRSLVVAKDNERWKLDLTMTATRSFGHQKGRGQFNFAKAEPSEIANGTDQNLDANLNLTVPIDDLSAHAAAVSARITLQQDNNNERSTVRQIDTKIEQLYQNIKMSKTRLQLDKDRVRLQKKTASNTYKQYQAGQASLFEWRLQQQNADTAENNLVTSKISYLNDILGFEAAIGTTLTTWHVAVNY